MTDPLSLREQQILEKISQAKLAANEAKKRERQAQRERQRTVKIQHICEQVKARLIPLRDQLEESIRDCSVLGESDPIYQDLKAQLAEVISQLENPVSIAEAIYQEELEQEDLQEQRREWEESVIAEEKRIEEDINRWRNALLEDILQTIEEAETYFEASDIAVYLRDYKEDLAALGQLEPVLVKLIERINILNTKGNPFELRYPIEMTLNRMVDFALNQRMQRTPSGSPRSSTSNGAGGLAQLKQAHRQVVDRPFEYRDLSGKVVVFGGHPRMHRNVLRRLPEVRLIWFDQDDSVTSMADRSDVVRDADLVILITAYTSHKVHNIAQSACATHGVSLIYHNNTGIRSMLELIALELQKRKFARKMG